MKVLVDVIRLETLQKIRPFFIKDNEITFLEYCDKSLAFYDFDKPYYIDENIEDLDKVLKTCDDVACEKSDIRNKVDWLEFDHFWWLMQEIKKQRDVGRKISDLEYVYEKTKNIVPVKYVDIMSLNQGYTFDSPHYCITGNSSFGEMVLYKDEEDFVEFVFAFSYKKKNMFGKERIEYSHIHPQDFDEAILDVIAWMKNDKSRFSWIK